MAIKKKFIKVCFLLALLCPNFLIAQEFKSVFPDDKFNHLSTEDGLSSTNINDILKDSNGFIWFATRNGLDRYNGTSFEVIKYNSDNPNSLNNNDVSSLIEDKNGILWVGTLGGGLNFFNQKTGQFGHYTTKSSEVNQITNDFITALTLDSNGNLWIGTKDGVNKFNISSKEFTKLEIDNKILLSVKDQSITTIFADKQNTIWIGSQVGLFRYYPSENRFKEYDLNELVDDKGFYKRIFSVFEDSSGSIFIGTGAGLAKYDKEKDVFSPHIKTSKEVVSLLDKVILCIDEDSHNQLWIGTWMDGLYILNKDSGELKHYTNDINNPFSLRQNSIRNVLIDKENFAWVCTYTEGVNLYNFREKIFPKISIAQKEAKLLFQSKVSAISKDINGNIWAGTIENGIFKINKNYTNVDHYDSKSGKIIDNEIESIYYDNDQILWVGTSNGLMRYNPKDDSFTPIELLKPTNGIDEIMIFSIADDDKNGLWLGTKEHGVLHYNTVNKGVRQFKHYEFDESTLVSDYILDLIIDKKGMVWVGTKLGLNMLNPRDGKVKRFYHEPKVKGSLSGNFVESLFEDKEGFLWFGTHGSGVNKLEYWADKNTPYFKHYQVKDGLPNDVVTGILEDQSGLLWLSTAQGLCKFNPKDETFIQYWQRDGLGSVSFTPGAEFKAQDGKLFFGTSKGFEAFYPNEIENLEKVPNLLLTDFKVNNKSVDISENQILDRQINETDTIILNHKQSAFTFEFVALNFSHGVKNKYAYMLDGLDDDWNYVGNRNEAIYTNIQPGTYTFKVKGANHHNIWNETPRQVTLIIKQPFWKTIWAYLLYIITISFITYHVRKLVVARQRLKTDLLFERKQREIDQKIHEIDELKLRFFTNISHEIRTPLTLILGPIKSLVNSNVVDAKISNKYRMIYRNAQRLHQLVTQLMDSSKIEFGKMKLKVERWDIIQFLKEITAEFEDISEQTRLTLEFNSSHKNYEGWFDHDKLQKICFNLISNAIKFTPPGNKIFVDVKIIEIDSPILELSIKDTGIGIAKDEQKSVFEHFHQVSPSLELAPNNTPWEGTGIGLSLTKQLVNLHKGKIELESEVGKGSNFKVFLPLGEESYSEKERMSRKEAKHISIRKIDPIIHDIPLVVEPNFETDKIVILIIDDNKDMRKYVKESLEGKFTTIEAVDGEDGIDTAFEHLPDLIICDLMMPGRNGIELTQVLKNDLRTSHIPIILLTAVNKRKERIDGFTSGADNYVTKPFDSGVLMARVLQLIESRKKLRERFSKEMVLKPKDITINSQDEKFLNDAIEVVENNMSDGDFDIDTFGTQLSMSRSQLYRKIRALTDQTPIEFIKLIRLKRAAQMLKSQEFTAAEVGYSVGFKTPAHFSRCFKEYFNVTPAKFVESKVSELDSEKTA